MRTRPAGSSRRAARPGSPTGRLRSDEAFRLARLEVNLAVLRAAGAVLSVVSLTGAGPRGAAGVPVDVAAPVVANALVLAFAVVVGVVARGLTDPTSLRRLGVGVAAVDLAAFAAYSATFHDVRGAGAFIGVLAVVEGPVRFRPPAALACVAAVAATAIAWPQADAGGFRQSPLTVLVLCALIGGSALIVTRLARRTADTLRHAQEQFSAAFQHASMGMALVDGDHQVLQANRALVEMVGGRECDVVGARVSELVDPADRAELDAALADAEAGHGRRLHVRLASSGEVRWALVTLSRLAAVASAGDQLVLHVEDVTERRRFEQQLAHQAGHDSLTGLPNRSQLVGRISRGLASSPPRIAVMFIDLDRFKHVNDARGHSAGDEMLKEVARRLTEVIRPGDIVARLGGDEFVVLCHEIPGMAGIAPIADRLVATLSAPFVVDGEQFFVGASIGVALPARGATAETLLRDADTAMYLAKAAGGGRHAVFVPSMRATALRKHDLEAALRSAVEQDELELHYQPTVDLRSREISSFEALLRWYHPTRGSVSPAEFIPVAEESDLIVDVGIWVMRAAMRQSVEWARLLPAESVPTMCINVSRRQLAQVGFVDVVSTLLAETGAAAGRICLEVTETALSGDVEPIIDTLEALRRLGVRLAIDDFGTGHASLTYLARFPVDVLKVDRSFVSGLGDDRGSEAIVGSVTAMGHAFGLQVVAEGVETEEQLERLVALGCDVAQGYLLSRPVTAPAATDLARRGVAWPLTTTRRPVALVPSQRAPLSAEALAAGAPGRPARRGSADAAQRYRLLLDLARDVTGCPDLDSVLKRTFAALRQITHFTGGSVQLVQADGQIGIAAADPPATEEAMAARIPVGHGVGGAIVLTGEPRYIADITADSAVTAARRSRNTSAGVRSYFGVPLISAGEVIGVLQVDSMEADAWTEEDRMLVLAFAPIVAAAVDHARRLGSRAAEMAEGV